MSGLAGAVARGSAAILVGLVALMLVLAAAAPAWAQDERAPEPQEEQADSVQDAGPERPDPKRQALERLRALQRPVIGRPDTVAAGEADVTADTGAVPEGRVEAPAGREADAPRDLPAGEPEAGAAADRPVDPGARPGAAAPAVPPAQAPDTTPRADRGEPPPDAAAERRAGEAAAAAPARDGARRDVAPDTTRRQQAARPSRVGGGTPGDSIMQALRGLDGYSVLEYEGAGARFKADRGRLELDGKALVDRQGQSMEVDSLLVYSRESAVVCGYGKPILSGEGSPVESELVCYDMERQTGMARDARTTFQEGATWYVQSREAYPVGNERLYSHDARFTSCDLEEPHYHFGARSIKIVHDDLMVARNVTLRFADVPVFWLPFMVQSLKTGRRSGLLTPRFSVNDIARTRTNYNRRIENVGFYWAMNDYMGTEVALDWYSDNWVALDGRLHYNWRERFLNGNLSFRRFWTTEGGKQLTLNSSNSWRPGERTSLSLSANYASSSSFVRRNSFDPHELRRNIDSNASLTHRFDWGNLTMGARRSQHLSDDRVDLTLPSMSLSLSPVTFFRAPPLEARWYNNATWSGSTRFDNRTTSRDLTLPGIHNRDTRHFTGSLNSSVNVGNFSWSQGATIREDVLQAKPELSWVVQQGDSSVIMQEDALPRELTQRIDWSSGLSYRLPLIGSTSLSPSVSVNSMLLRSPASEDELVSGPIQPNFSAALSTDIFGFWPGVGPYRRLRHRLSPSVTYNYRPPVEVTDRQREVFGISDLAEQNQITVTLNQTFEAQLREEEEPSSERQQRRPQETRERDTPRGPVPPPPDEADATDADDVAAPDAESEAEQDEAEAPLDDGPRRLPRPRTITLLALNTSAVTYDFVRARERGWWHAGSPPGGVTDFGREYGFGWTTTQLSNSVRSDLLQGFSLRLTHDLFRTEPPDEPGGQPIRSFAPHLQSVNASFTLDANSWIFRVLGLAGALAGRDDRGDAPSDPEDPLEDEFDRSDDVGGRIMGGDRAPATMPRGAGPWRASLDFSMTRPRDREVSGLGNQLLRGNMSFQPTENWNLRWSTGYSFTANEFQTHVLTLTRDLHRWEANFDFIKAPNGNFSFQFRVNLRDNPDVKFDYQQRSDASAFPAGF